MKDVNLYAIEAIIRIQDMEDNFYFNELVV